INARFGSACAIRSAEADAGFFTSTIGTPPHARMAGCSGCRMTMPSISQTALRKRVPAIKLIIFLVSIRAPAQPDANNKWMDSDSNNDSADKTSGDDAGDFQFDQLVGGFADGSQDFIGMLGVCRCGPQLD